MPSIVDLLMAWDDEGDNGPGTDRGGGSDSSSGQSAV
jgi:hypothetical protein